MFPSTVSGWTSMNRLMNRPYRSGIAGPERDVARVVRVLLWRGPRTCSTSGSISRQRRSAPAASPDSPSPIGNFVASFQDAGVEEPLDSGPEGQFSLAVCHWRESDRRRPLAWWGPVVSGRCLWDVVARRRSARRCVYRHRRSGLGRRRLPRTPTVPGHGRCAGGWPGRRGAGAGGRGSLWTAGRSAGSPGSGGCSRARGGITPPSRPLHRWCRTGHPTALPAAGRWWPGHRAGGLTR
jgi:hypothetical protein